MVSYGNSISTREHADYLNKMEMGIEEWEAKKSSGLATLVSYHTRTLSLHLNT